MYMYIRHINPYLISILANLRTQRGLNQRILGYLRGPILGTKPFLASIQKGPWHAMVGFVGSLKEIEEFKEGLLEGGWPWSIAPDHQADLSESGPLGAPISGNFSWKWMKMSDELIIIPVYPLSGQSRGAHGKEFLLPLGFRDCVLVVQPPWEAGNLQFLWPFCDHFWDDHFDLHSHFDPILMAQNSPFWAGSWRSIAPKKIRWRLCSLEADPTSNPYPTHIQPISNPGISGITLVYLG